MASKKTLYLANPYGFSLQQREGPLAALTAALETLGVEVWEPFTRNNQVDKVEAGWAYRIGQADLEDVRAADGLFAVVNGCPPDEGVMVELGMAIAWEKPVFLFRDDFRRCTDSEAYPLNLMVFHRPSGVRLGDLLVRLGGGDRRPRQGPGPMGEGPGAALIARPPAVVDTASGDRLSFVTWSGAFVREHFPPGRSNPCHMPS